MGVGGKIYICGGKEGVIPFRDSSPRQTSEPPVLSFCTQAHN